MDEDCSREMCSVQTNLALIDGGREARIVGSGFEDDLVSHGEKGKKRRRRQRAVIGSNNYGMMPRKHSVKNNTRRL